MGIADDENNDDDVEAEEAEGGTTMMSMAMAMLMRMRLRVENRDDAREMEMCDVRWKLVLTPAMTLTATNWASQGQTEVLTNWGEVGGAARGCQTARLLDCWTDNVTSV